MERTQGQEGRALSLSFVRHPKFQALLEKGMTFSTDPGSGKSHLSEVSLGSSEILASEVRELERELDVARRKANWHFLWTVLGVSPAAIIPTLGLLREGSIGLLVLLAVLVTISQGYLGAKASRRAGDLEATLKKLKEG